MNQEKGSPPIIVPLSEVARVFEKALPKIAEAAGEGTADGIPPGDALALAAVGLTLRAIQDAPPGEAASRVMETKQNGAVSRLQSLIASGEKAECLLVPIPHGGLEAKFDTRDLIGWASVAWAKIRNPRKHPLLPAAGTAESFPDTARVGLLGDWGTGLYGAPVMAGTIAGDAAS